MEQTAGGQNKNDSFYKRNIVSIIIAVIVVAAALYFSFGNKKDEQASSDDEQGQEQTAGGSNEQSQNGDAPSPQPAAIIPSEDNGNITAAGKLLASDNPQRGNLMVEGLSGKIYINTKRDFSSLLGQEVSLQAQGTINSFVFLGLSKSGAAGSVAGTDTDARGGVPDSEVARNVSFTGTLLASDNTTRGNYVVSSGNTKVYLKTVRNYTSLVNSQVTLTAAGTLASFINARVAPKK